jgi:hypothetical protein
MKLSMGLKDELIFITPETDVTEETNFIFLLLEM